MSRSHATTTGSPDSAARQTRSPDELNPPMLHRCGSASVRRRRQQPDRSQARSAREMNPRAWTIPVGATAPETASVIHSDFQRGFIKAECRAPLPVRLLLACPPRRFRQATKDDLGTGEDVAGGG